MNKIALPRIGFLARVFAGALEWAGGLRLGEVRNQVMGHLVGIGHTSLPVPASEWIAELDEGAIHQRAARDLARVASSGSIEQTNRRRACPNHDLIY